MECLKGFFSFHIFKEILTKGELPENLFAHYGNLILDEDMLIEAIAREQLDT